MNRYEVTLADGSKCDVHAKGMRAASNGALEFFSIIDSTSVSDCVHILWNVRSCRVISDGHGALMPPVHVETIAGDPDAIPSLGDELPRIDYRRKRSL